MTPSRIVKPLEPAPLLNFGVRPSTRSPEHVLCAAIAPCQGCGGLFPDTDGPTHACIGASPGCWALYSEVLAKEYGEYRYPAVHQLTVHAYAAQHPGTPSRRSIQSVAGHLIGLYLVLDRGLNAKRATAMIREAIAQRGRFMWLEPPPSMGPLTVLDVAGATHLAGHVRLVEQWANSVWDAWAEHHETIRNWALMLRAEGKTA